MVNKVINQARTQSGMHAEIIPNKDIKKKQRYNKVDWMPILTEREENYKIWRIFKGKFWVQNSQYTVFMKL